MPLEASRELAGLYPTSTAELVIQVAALSK
jgi:hypothetical protein